LEQAAAKQVNEIRLLLKRKGCCEENVSKQDPHGGAAGGQRNGSKKSKMQDACIPGILLEQGKTGRKRARGCFLYSQY
jgi:hypothetical protein